jgi:hypothetical protein
MLRTKELKRIRKPGMEARMRVHRMRGIVKTNMNLLIMIIALIRSHLRV